MSAMSLGEARRMIGAMRAAGIRCAGIESLPGVRRSSIIRVDDAIGPYTGTVATVQECEALITRKIKG